MPTYKDEKTGTWYCKFYYEDATGTRKQKMKRGFQLQREAKEWERNFLEQQQGTSDMSFSSLCELYLADCKQRNKKSSYITKECIYNKHIEPYWKNKPINQITPANVRKWQGVIESSKMSQSYKYQVNKFFSIAMNYAVKYYGLRSNPCHAAGSVGKSNVRRLEFWTLEQFKAFIKTESRIDVNTAFMVLFYTGIRVGELLALTLEDFDLDNKTVSISKTYHRYDKTDHITTPKTENSCRTVSLSPFLVDAIKEFISHIYGVQPEDRIFSTVTPRILKHSIKQGCEAVNMEPIRIHSLRHSHVSLLIDMGVSPHLIAERIGDNVEMVNSVYGHLYPNRHTEVADKLQKIVSN